MSRTRPNHFLDRYEAAVDDIIASCKGDLRGAIRALMLANEQLEHELQRMAAELNDQLPDCAPPMLMH